MIPKSYATAAAARDAAARARFFADALDVLATKLEEIEGASVPAAPPAPAAPGAIGGSEPFGLWRTQEVAKFLRVSTSWVYQRTASGVLPCVRIGAAVRFEPEAIKRFASGQGKNEAPGRPKR